MAALTTGRTSAQMDNQVEPNLIGYPMAVAKVFIGALVGLNTSGFVIGASSDPTLQIVGCADRVQPDASKGGVPGAFVDNSANSAGDLTLNVKRGVFKFENGDTIVAADVGKPCYASDDQTVNKSSSNNSRPFAGYIVQVDASTSQASNSGAGVWVAVGLTPTQSEQFIANLNAVANSTSLTDADATIQITSGTWRKLAAATLSAARILTLGNTGAKAGDQITITRLDATANAYTVKDNAAATLLVMPASKVNYGLFQHDGTNWFLRQCGVQ